jgi:hypothetical protein
MFVIFECPYLVHNTSFRPTSNLFSIFDKKSLHASLTSIGVINDNKFMKVRLLSRVNSRGSNSLNGNCNSTPGWTYSGGTVPNPVLELGSHRIPNPGSGIQLLLSSCVTHTHVVCHTHTPLFVSKSRGVRPFTNTQLAIPIQLNQSNTTTSSHSKWHRWWKCFDERPSAQPWRLLTARGLTCARAVGGASSSADLLAASSLGQGRSFAPTCASNRVTTIHFCQWQKFTLAL